MPIDTIGELDLRLAESEASDIEKGPQALRTLGADIGDSMQGALKSAEILQQNEINVQKDKEAEALLASGAQGVAQYASEIGIADPTVYTQMAENVKDPKQFVDIYALMRKRADKDTSEREFSELISGISGVLKDAMGTTDPEKIALARNAVNAAKGKTTNPNAIKQLESMGKGLSDHENTIKDKTVKPVDKQKELATKLNLSMKEAKHFDSRIKESKIIKDKANGVMIAVDRAIGDVQSGKDPDNLTLDQVLGVSLQKVLDPPSVVRESEFDRLKMGQAFFSALKGKWEALRSGGVGLTDESRARTVQFIKDMAQLADRNIRKEMLTVGVRSGFGERYDPQEIDATMFTPEEMAKMKDIYDGKTKAEDEMIDERIKSNVKWLMDNPDILSKRTKRQKSTSSEAGSSTAPKAKTQDISPKQFQDELNALFPE